MEQKKDDNAILSEHDILKSFQYFVSDLKKYVVLSMAILFIHSILLYLGCYLWVNYNGLYESQFFLEQYIHIGFDIGYLFSHNLWWLSLRIHFVVSMVCLIYALICKFFLFLNNYEVANFPGRLLCCYVPNMIIAAFFIEDAYIFDYQTALMTCFLPGLFMSHASMILVRTVVPDLGDIHRLILWCMYRNKTVPAQM